MEGTLVPKARARDSTRRRRAVPLAKEDLVLSPWPPDLVLDPHAYERREKRETVQGASPDPVKREQKSPRDSALKAVASHSLGAGVDANDTGRPAKHETVYQNSLCGGIHKCLPQFQVLNL